MEPNLHFRAWWKFLVPLPYKFKSGFEVTQTHNQRTFSALGVIGWRVKMIAHIRLVRELQTPFPFTVSFPERYVHTMATMPSTFELLSLRERVQGAWWNYVMGNLIVSMGFEILMTVVMIRSSVISCRLIRWNLIHVSPKRRWPFKRPEGRYVPEDRNLQHHNVHSSSNLLQ